MRLKFWLSAKKKAQDLRDLELDSREQQLVLDEIKLEIGWTNITKKQKQLELMFIEMMIEKEHNNLKTVKGCYEDCIK